MIVIYKTKVRTIIIDAYGLEFFPLDEGLKETEKFVNCLEETINELSTDPKNLPVRDTLFQNLIRRKSIYFQDLSLKKLGYRYLFIVYSQNGNFVFPSYNLGRSEEIEKLIKSEIKRIIITEDEGIVEVA